MKSKLLGLMAPVLLFGLSPAYATTYTYTVNFAISTTDTVTGTMMTDCDSCSLGATDFGPWSFKLPGIGTISSSDAGATTAIGIPTDLTASLAGLSYNGEGCGGPVTFNGGVGGLNFECGFIADYPIPASTDKDFLDLDQNPSFQFATMATTSATPLPAALPLFAVGLGSLGLFGWRRKRKNAAAL